MYNWIHQEVGIFKSWKWGGGSGVNISLHSDLNHQKMKTKIPSQCSHPGKYPLSLLSWSFFLSPCRPSLFLLFLIFFPLCAVLEPAILRLYAHLILDCQHFSSSLSIPPSPLLCGKREKREKRIKKKTNEEKEEGGGYFYF